MEINREDQWVTDQWVTDQLAITEPDWRPDIVRARIRLDAAREPHRRFAPWLVTAGAAAAICVVALAVPATRAMAQELWARLVLNRIDVVRLDLSDLPLDTHVKLTDMTRPAKGLDEAEQMAGFRPHLPSGVLSAVPKWTVTGPMAIGQTIHVHELEAALVKAHATDVHVAPEWEGVTLSTVVGPMVGLDYPGDIEVLQAPPFSVTMPARFPLETFAEVAFRSVGASPRDAETMARKFAANPAWLLDVSPDEVVNIQELSLVNGPALLIEEYGDHGAAAKDTVIRSTKDRIYLVSSPNRDLSVKIAGSLP